MLFKEKIAYSHWLKLYRRIAKPERFGIGEKIDKLFLEVLEVTHEMRFATSSAKPTYLNKAIQTIDKMKFFSEICWENKLITAKDLANLLTELETIGRELGGWKKGILNKNSQPLGLGEK